MTVPIARHKVPEKARSTFLPNLVSVPLMGLFENKVYDFLDKFCEGYNGGYWEFYRLSNGGGYMAPSIDDTTMKLEIESNGYSGTMSGDAAGIVVTLFALNYLIWRFPHATMLIDHYHALRDYAAEHSESAAIFAAID
jgi:hypothetical protein